MTDRWQDTALRFADPTFAADWAPEDRPAWPLGPKATFRQWVLARLEELVPADGSAGLLRGARAEDLEPWLWKIADAVAQADFSGVGDLERRYKLKAIQLTKDGKRPSLEQVERAMRNDAEALAAGAKRRGPARGADPDKDRRAIIDAAWDLWLIRRVILPRFWPERAGEQLHLPGGATEQQRMIAERHGSSEIAKKALSEYRKQRLANR